MPMPKIGSETYKTPVRVLPGRDGKKRAKGSRKFGTTRRGRARK